MTLTIHQYREADEPEVLDLIKSSLGESPAVSRTSEYWRWKHFENPFGPSHLLLARVSGRLAGLRAYLRWRFVTPSGELSALRAVDTATHPRHRRQGVFRALTMEANRRAEEEGFDLIFNTPNSQSRPGYVSMGWTVVGKPRVYVRPLRLRGINDEAVIYGGDAPTVASQFEDRPPLGLRTERSVEYLRWRFVRHPTVSYRMVSGGSGTALVRSNSRRGRAEIVVSEVLGPGGGVPSGLRTAVDADYLVAVSRPGSPEAGAFIRSGLLPVPGVGLTLVALPLTNRARAAASLSAWDLSAGDLELM